MKKKIISFFVSSVFVVTSASAFPFAEPLTPAFAETRCGWFSNPTPANAWLNDAQGEWLISTQGGEQADGDWPIFKDSQWIKTNVNYGYGCACMKVEVDGVEKRITKIISSYAKPISACRKDKTLKKNEPK